MNNESTLKRNLKVVCGFWYHLCKKFINNVGLKPLYFWGNEADAYAQLLQTGDYDPNHKRNFEKHELIGGIYWCTVTAIYLAISFITGAWGYTWIIWPVTGVFYGVIACIINYTERKKGE